MQEKNIVRYYSGLSGLQLPIKKSLFPLPFQNASRLSYYSSLLNSIEINSSFYKVPGAGTVSKWSAAVAENFLFTFKLWKGITHNKELQFNKEDVAAFFSSINEVQYNNGCLLIQFPAGLSIQLTQLKKLLKCISAYNKTAGWKIAIEFRNQTWYQQPVYELVQMFNAAIVIHDMPKSATPLINHFSEFIYVRFHGPTGNYRGSYSESFLKENVCYIKEWIKEGKTVFVYFNNTMGDAFNNVVQLNSLYQTKK